jgi:hypothetical protein
VSDSASSLGAVQALYVVCSSSFLFSTVGVNANLQCSRGCCSRETKNSSCVDHARARLQLRVYCSHYPT